MSRDGRFYIFDVEAFNADGAHIPVDLEHGITKNDEPNGLCGRVNWLSAFKDILSARSRRFIFPSSLSQIGRATCLHSVVLVAGSRHSQCRRFSKVRNRASSNKVYCQPLGLGTNTDEAAYLTVIPALPICKFDRAVRA
jgi:hypothetical protein